MFFSFRVLVSLSCVGLDFSMDKKKKKSTQEKVDGGDDGVNLCFQQFSIVASLVSCCRWSEMQRKKGEKGRRGKTTAVGERLDCTIDSSG